MKVAEKKKSPKKLSVEEQKNALAIKVLSLKDEGLVQSITTLFDDVTEPIKKTSKKQYNKEIDAAVKRVRNGNSISNAEFLKDFDNV